MTSPAHPLSVSSGSSNSDSTTSTTYSQNTSTPVHNFEESAHLGAGQWFGSDGSSTSDIGVFQQESANELSNSFL